MRISLLGGVAATNHDGLPIDIGPARSQALLAALALTPRRAVPVTRLVELVWGAAPPRTAEKTLQTYVARLRTALGPQTVVRVGAAYRLDVEPGTVDVARFRARLAAGEVAAALAEWTGMPLAGLDADGLTATADALVEEWLGAVEADLADLIDVDPAAAVSRLTELTEQHPFREGLWALLMTALYRTDRQADALTAYQDLRGRLDAQLGVEPSPRLRELERSILNQDEAWSGPSRSHQGPPAPLPHGPTDRSPGRTLPHRPGQLHGRDADRVAVAAALTVAPVVTLVGPGGIGKTRLALAVAEQHQAIDGVWLAELAEVAAPDDVLRTVADVLGVREAAGRSLTTSVVAALRSRDGLMVLDNCEHVVDAVAGLVQAVVEGCPDAHVLTTSREGLGVEGERLVTVGPLDPEGAAVELFGERALAIDQSFDIDLHRDEIVDVCRRLDGVPLAIELAAARTRTHSLVDLRDGLDDHLRLLTGGRRTAEPRHRTLQATVRWSYDMLDDAEQQVFHRLSVFAGPFDLQAATHVAVDRQIDSAELADLVGGLVEKSMLTSTDGRSGNRSFRMLETIRQFAAARLVEVGQAEQVAARHSRWCLQQVVRIHDLLVGHQERTGVEQLRDIWPELRAAVKRSRAGGDVHQGFALIRPIIGEILLRSAYEIGDWVEDLLDVTPPEDAELRILGVAWAAQRYASTEDPAAFEALVARVRPPDDVLVDHARVYVHDDYAQLVDQAPRAVAEWRRRGAHHMADLTEPDLGVALLHLGRLDEHDAHVEALAEHHRRHGPPTLHNWALMLLGYSASFRGDQARADRLFDEAVAIDLPARTYSPNKPIEARVLFRRGEHQRAFRTLRAHVCELLEAETLQATSIAALEFVNMMAAMGRIDDAAWALAYLRTTELLASEGFRGLVSEAAQMVADANHRLTHQPDGWQGGDRAALLRMRQALDLLL